MNQIERAIKMQLLLEQIKINEEKLNKMSDEEIEYFHWLYFEDSVYDLM